MDTVYWIANLIMHKTEKQTSSKITIAMFLPSIQKPKPDGNFSLGFIPCFNRNRSISSSSLNVKERISNVDIKDFPYILLYCMAWTKNDWILQCKNHKPRLLKKS